MAMNLGLSSDIYNKINGFGLSNSTSTNSLSDFLGEDKYSEYSEKVDTARDISGLVFSSAELIKQICELTTGDILKAICNALAELSGMILDGDNLLNTLGISGNMADDILNILNNTDSSNFGDSLSNISGIAGDICKNLADSIATFIDCFVSGDDSLLNGLFDKAKGIFDKVQEFLDDIGVTDVLKAIGELFDATTSLLKDISDIATALLADLAEALDISNVLKRLCESSFMNPDNIRSPLNSISKYSLKTGANSIRTLLK